MRQFLRVFQIKSYLLHSTNAGSILSKKSYTSLSKIDEPSNGKKDQPTIGRTKGNFMNKI
jgi:hypothetical protein